ncbi:40S ribosomal protein S22 [Colletotrichum paranaense]|uniref:40S ribosomal protein S22 n=1 Tax=Colletotrichum paranaense TaxID=1914294 RepID=A0ABQ9SJR6_9PEZI|nr:40S ribosomal protein S22 [Colletotrichum paranaense]KAK1537885.1 40S ribosomal protein S22 [Colletotrichum paranaense]
MATCLTSRKSMTTEAAKLSFNSTASSSSMSPTCSANHSWLTLFSLNKCGVISPHSNVRLGDLEKWGVRLLPARQFGQVVLTTSAGIMHHHQARRKNISGKILGYFY